MHVLEFNLKKEFKKSINVLFSSIFGAELGVKNEKKESLECRKKHISA